MEQRRIWTSKVTRSSINMLASDIHEYAKGKGFWDDPRSDGECIALMHSELSEALEGLRNGNKADDHCPDFGNVEVEMADCVIRILDFCRYKGYNIAKAIDSKMEYNMTRPYKHGKKF